MRSRVLLGSFIVTLLAPGLLVWTPAAHAVTIYKWTGAESTVWGNPKNWEPNGKPKDGDGVELGPGARPTITEVPDISLSTLSVTGNTDGLVSMSGEGHVITGNLKWNGGDINVDLTVSAPPLDPTPSYIMMGEHSDALRLRRQPDAHRQQHPVADDRTVAAGDGAWLTFMFDSGMRIASTGKLLVDPAARMAANRCCAGPTSTVIVDGTLEVFSITGATGYTARLDELGVDLAGDVVVPKGNTLEITGGPIRVGGHAINGTVGDASISGGGTVDIEETDGDAYDPEHPLLPDGTMKFIEDGEKLTLADDTVLRLGQYTEVSGVGSIVGKGSVEPRRSDRARPADHRRRRARDDQAGDRGPRSRSGTRTVPGQTGLAHARRRAQGRARRGGPGDGRRRASDHAEGRHARAPGGRRARLRRLLHRHRPGDAPEGLDDEDRRGRRRSRARSAGSSSAARAPSSTPAPRRGTWPARRSPAAPGSPARAPSPATCPPVRPRSGRAASSRSTATSPPTSPGSPAADAGPAQRAEGGRAVGRHRERRAVGPLQPIGDTSYPVGRRVVVLEAGSITGGYRCANALGMIMDTTATTVGLHGIEAMVSDCLRPEPTRGALGRLQRQPADRPRAPRLRSVDPGRRDGLGRGPRHHAEAVGRAGHGDRPDPRASYGHPLARGAGRGPHQADRPADQARTREDRPGRLRDVRVSDPSSSAPRRSSARRAGGSPAARRR